VGSGHLRTEPTRHIHPREPPCIQPDIAASSEALDLVLRHRLRASMEGELRHSSAECYCGRGGAAEPRARRPCVVKSAHQVARRYSWGRRRCTRRGCRGRGSRPASRCRCGSGGAYATVMSTKPDQKPPVAPVGAALGEVVFTAKTVGRVTNSTTAVARPPRVAILRCALLAWLPRGAFWIARGGRVPPPSRRRCWCGGSDGHVIYGALES